MFREKIVYLNGILLPFLVILFVDIYKKSSGFFIRKKVCRFYPSCSDYIKEAFKKKGFCEGLFFSIRRIIRCHPFNPGGIDFL